MASTNKSNKESSHNYSIYCKKYLSTKRLLNIIDSRVMSWKQQLGISNYGLGAGYSLFPWLAGGRFMENSDWRYGHHRKIRRLSHIVSALWMQGGSIALGTGSVVFPSHILRFVALCPFGQLGVVLSNFEGLTKGLTGTISVYYKNLQYKFTQQTLIIT